MEKYKKSFKPPRIAERILRLILPDKAWDTPLGDFEEYYKNIVHEKGSTHAPCIGG